MKLIVVLAGILIDRVFPWVREYRDYNYFLRYADWVKAKLPEPLANGAIGVSLVMIPPVAVVWYLDAIMSGGLAGAIGLLFSLVVFLYCLGPRDLFADVDTFCNVCESTDVALRVRAAALLTGREAPDAESESLFADVTRAILSAGHDRLFAVLFWFVLLGPVGALLYRGLGLLAAENQAEPDFRDWAERLRAMLVWIPARLTALGYALAGHFDAAFEGWQDAAAEMPAGAGSSEHLLVETGLGALDLRDRDDVWTGASAPRAAMRLVWRTLTLWLVVVAVLTLAGWAS